MKSRVKAIISSVVSALCAVAFACVSYGNVKNAVAVLPEKFTLTAHTGCEKTPDNSLEAIRIGFEAGADIVEFDLNFDSDGRPVLSHDSPEGECVTLDEAFSCVAEYDSLKVNVDVKNTQNLKAVVECAEKYSLMERIFYTGITENDVEAVKQQTPEVTYFLNYDVKKSKKSDKDYLIALADKVEEVGAVGINLNYRKCSKELVELFHSRNLLVSVWTVNNKYDMYKVMLLSPDNVTTRYPSVLKKIIEKHK